MTPRRRMLASSVRRLAAGVGAALAIAVGLAATASPRRAPRPVIPPPTLPSFDERVDLHGLLRGNVHAHSMWSDGDSPPEDVVLWYRRHGYNFAAITDHNSRVPIELFAHLERPGFVLLPGEEVTMTVDGKPVHVNALCTQTTINGWRSDSKAAALQYAIDAARAQGGFAIINHPNFEWALDASDLMATEGASMLEIASAHPFVRWQGRDEHASAEALWTRMLDEGSDIAPVAVDDGHRFKEISMRSPQARPGGAWVGVLGAALNRPSICGALARGDVFASTGPEIHRIRVEKTRMLVELDGPPHDVEFVGAAGRVLSERTTGRSGRASYELVGGEQYVRARVTDGEGRQAWTRAFRVSH